MGNFFLALDFNKANIYEYENPKTTSRSKLGGVYTIILIGIILALIIY